MRTKVDLSSLAVTRDVATPTTPAARRGNVLTRIVLPGLLLAGFGVLVAYAGWETLSPPRAITVIPVTTSTARLDAPPDTPLFRAAGWVEPRPTPIIVTALAEGVVEQLLVVEGQQVEKGQTIAQLVSADAKLLLEAAEAEVELRESELASATAAQAGARARLELPVHLQAELADAETALARAKSDLALLPFTLAAAEARHEYAKKDHDGQQRAGSAVTYISVSRALSDMNSAAGSLRELQTRQKRLPVEIAALEAKAEAQRQKLQRKVDEIRQAGEAEAAVKAAQAKLRLARATRELARLRLERMEIKAPASGRVLGLVARPGTRLNGLISSSLQDSSTVVTLYDPASLQVRVDVRLDDVGKVRAGLKVRIDCAALPDVKLQGEVLLATSQADIQKNTLSVKVLIQDPPATLKPEMLCQATFLAPPRAATAAEGSETARLLVPRQLIDSSNGGAGLWVADQVTGTARFRVVQLGLTAGDLVEIVSGLAAQERLIVSGREGLVDGTRIRIVGEDEALGIAPPSRRKK